MRTWKIYDCGDGTFIAFCCGYMSAGHESEMSAAEWIMDRYDEMAWDIRRIITAVSSETSMAPDDDGLFAGNDEKIDAIILGIDEEL